MVAPMITWLTRGSMQVGLPARRLEGIVGLLDLGLHRLLVDIVPEATALAEWQVGEGQPGVGLTGLQGDRLPELPFDVIPLLLVPVAQRDIVVGEGSRESCLARAWSSDIFDREVDPLGVQAAAGPPADRAISAKAGRIRGSSSTEIGESEQSRVQYRGGASAREFLVSARASAGWPSYSRASPCRGVAGVTGTGGHRINRRIARRRRGPPRLGLNRFRSPGQDRREDLERPLAASFGAGGGEILVVGHVDSWIPGLDLGQGVPGASPDQRLP